MAKVFRFHEDTNTIEDWQSSQPYGSNAINGIQDPDGAKASKEITSIPSPFARIDLAKTAYENIVSSQNLDGISIYHKMVSYSLDVAEIFFNIDKFKDKIEIIVWDPKTDLNTLLDSNNPKHQLLGKTLDLFLKQDAKAYNFDEVQRLYLLNYTLGPDRLNIIGGTSPASLFFTTANKLDYVDIQFGNHKVFDGVYQPFYKRDFEFQKFIYGLRDANPKFTTYFKSFSAYLDLSFKLLSSEQRAEINSLTKADFESQFGLQEVNSGNPIEILGLKLRKRVESTEDIETKSGFTIKSSKYQGIKPLVLPVDTFSEPVVYTTANWDRNNKAPFTDPKPLEQRVLPFDLSSYPYLTISDFLEPYIIQTIYPIYSDKFFDGNLNANGGDSKNGFLLPVKKDYFDYFDINDLLGIMPDGKKAIEINVAVTGGVNVTLRIPIKDNKYISYTRTYYPSVNDYTILTPNEESNKGTVIENQFGLTLFPFIKSQTDYRIVLTDYDVKPHTKHNKYQLSFYTENQMVETRDKKQRSNKEHSTITSEYYILENGFDYIVMTHNWATGIIIPKFRTQPNGTSQFTFAIDFGTTNTHIEYSKDLTAPVPFEINENDIQIATLHNPDDSQTKLNLEALSALAIDEIIIKEFLPTLINKNTDFSFPQRTVINANKDLDLDKSTFSLANFNIPFNYEKTTGAGGSYNYTNLKWSNNKDDVKRIEAFLENLIFLIKNKVVLNGGDLNQTKLIWLYPSSMSKHRINMFGNTWNRLFKKHINDLNIPLRISESVAPFYYFNKQLGIQALQNPVASVDIGGGTTDVVIYANNQPQTLSSFKFASNAIFGDFINRSSSINGFIIKYLDRIKVLLNQNKQYPLLSVLEEIEQTGKSEDIIAFFFSIEKNKKIKDSNIPISFSNKLMLNEDFKIIFVLFYAALVYHLAKIMKGKGLGKPCYITFSGTGSKIINLIDGDQTLNTLNQYTKLIFNKVYSDSHDYSSELKQVDNPKELSCKGALLSNFQIPLDIEKIKTILVGTKTETHKRITYDDIDSALESELISEYMDFVDLFFDLNKEFKYKENFGINPANMDSYKEFIKENAVDNLKLGIESKKQDLNTVLSDELDETLFFYPLSGALNNLAYKIETHLKNQISK